MKFHRIFSVMLVAGLMSLFAVSAAKAIPSFSRKYKTSCSTCHYALPLLNGFGKAFKNNGYRYPAGQDAEMIKEEPVSLGSEGYKRVWPDAIWPTDIAGTSPISIHLIGQILHSANSESGGDPMGHGHEEAVVHDDKILSFKIPHEARLVYGGTLDDNFSYYGEFNVAGMSALTQMFSVNYDYKPQLHLRLGMYGLRLWPEMHRLATDHYNVEALENQSGTWSLHDGSGGGAELWGAGNGSGGRGGFTYTLGLANGQSDMDMLDMNSAKDVYGRVTYKLGGLGEIGGTEGQATETSAFYLDNSVRLGGFFYSGEASDTASLSDKFSFVGGDIDCWYGRLNVLALAMSMNSKYNNIERKSLAWFVEGNYVIYPWMIGEIRYEFTDEDIDDDTEDPATSIIPMLVVMARANVRTTLEYMIPLDEANKDSDRFTLQFNIAF